MKKIRVGIVGASGYGGNELVRLVLGHPHLELVYAAADSSAGKKLSEMLPWIPADHDQVLKKWDADVPLGLDLIFISLPTGQSKIAASKIGDDTKIIDLGGDHRFQDGWTYGMADIWPDQIRKAWRIANPGCYPTAVITALAPLVRLPSCAMNEVVIIDAKSGISGGGRGSNGASYGYSEYNENVSAYTPVGHVHIPEMQRALGALAGRGNVRVAFTPHLVPMTRGILATCYIRCDESTATCLEIAGGFYRDRPFVRVSEKLPHTKWATGSNLVFVSYASNPQAGLVTAIAAIDNLGKGAASQAVQNANLMFGLEVSDGLNGTPLIP